MGREFSTVCRGRILGQYALPAVRRDQRGLPRGAGRLARTPVARTRASIPAPLASS